MTRVARIAACAAFVPLVFVLGACSTSKGTRAPSSGAVDTTVGPAGTGQARGGGYYLDDGPGHLSSAEVASIPDAVPRAEPVLARTSRPYTVFGRTYTPMSSLVPHRERGMASWYGRRYHGKPTSSGEKYDMYAMTAAHPTLPIPSYVRVTHIGSGRSVVVRVNDRGPFLQNRVIDLSYTAAAKLGFVQAGSAEVEVETITQFGAPQAVPVQRVRAQDATPPTAPASSVASTPVADEPSADEPAAAPTLAVRTSVAQDAPLQRDTLQLSQEAGAALPVAASAASAAPAAPGFWLQLGAFASGDRARAALDRFRRELSWLGASFDVRREGSLYKVQAGPWPQREHALDAAARVRGATALEPFPVFR